MAQAAALEEVATSKLRQPLARKKPFNYTDVHVGESGLFHEHRIVNARQGSAARQRSLTLTPPG